MIGEAKIEGEDEAGSSRAKQRSRRSSPTSWATASPSESFWKLLEKQEPRACSATSRKRAVQVLDRIIHVAQGLAQSFRRRRGPVVEQPAPCARDDRQRAGGARSLPQPRRTEAAGLEWEGSFTKNNVPIEMGTNMDDKQASVNGRAEIEVPSNESKSLDAELGESASQWDKANRNGRSNLWMEGAAEAGRPSMLLRPMAATFRRTVWQRPRRLGRRSTVSTTCCRMARTRAARFITTA
jgi:hypothetical protein